MGNLLLDFAYTGKAFHGLLIQSVDEIPDDPAAFNRLLFVDHVVSGLVLRPDEIGDQKHDQVNEPNIRKAETHLPFLLTSVGAFFLRKSSRAQRRRQSE